MVRPSAPCLARLRLTTKQVNGGYYKGNRTGSMGAHTEWGGYVIDYRKTRNFVCPHTKDKRLSPFVTMQIKPQFDDAVIPTAGSIIDAWRSRNSDQYEMKRQEWKDYLGQKGMLETDSQVPENGEVDIIPSLDSLADESSEQAQLAESTYTTPKIENSTGMGSGLAQQGEQTTEKRI